MHATHTPTPTTFTPCLTRDASVHRHSYRGTPWYIVHDGMTGRSLHLAAGAWRVIDAMDGRRSPEEILAYLQRNGAPVQANDVHSVCAELLRAGLLQGTTCEQADSLQLASQPPPRWKQWLTSPLSIRLPLLNPQVWLDKRIANVRPLFTSTTLWLWLSVVITACFMAVSHQNELTERVASTVISPYGVILFLSVYAVMKSLHELAHAFSIRAFGGAVNEMGLVFLVFMPVPYVDAAAATTFVNKRQRMLVSASGIMVEAFIGAIALILWTKIEPGVVREICFAALIIGGVSTLLFNGNPLLRFDGYYVLSDALEIPNLATRSRRYLHYAIQRYMLRMKDAITPVVTPSERLWFVLYGVLSSIYRLIILAFIVWFVSRQVPLVGYALGAWVFVSQLLLPALRGFTSVVTRARNATNSRQVLSRLSATTLACGVVTFGLPMPAWSSAEGVIWMPPEAQVRAPVDGTVATTLLGDGTGIVPEQAIVQLESPSLVNDARVIAEQLNEVRARQNLALFRDRSALRSVAENLHQTEMRLTEAQQKVRSLTLKSPVAGALHFFDENTLAGRYVRKGEVLAYVRDDQAPIVRVVVKQTQIEKLRDPNTNVRVLIPGYLDRQFAATLVQEVGATTNTLPSAALGSAGGGRIATNLTDEHRRTAAEDVFILDVQLAPNAPDVAIGTRVYLRFDYAPAPLAQQMLRSLRQLTLGGSRA